MRGAGGRRQVVAVDHTRGNLPLLLLVADEKGIRTQRHRALTLPRHLSLPHPPRRVSGRALVEGAHMELAEPTVAQAVAACVAGGARRVVIAPYFLSRGRHIQEDIPALAAAAAADHPGVDVTVAEPIGLDPLMAQLIEQRVAAAPPA